MMHQGLQADLQGSSARKARDAWTKTRAELLAKKEALDEWTRELVNKIKEKENE
jgi:hypothetical protein